MEKLKLILKLLLRILKYLGLLILGYFILVLILSLIPVNSDFKPAEHGIDVFVSTNGIHVGFHLPATANGIEWRESLFIEDFPEADSSFSYLAFGWGEKDFYINTPTWGDLTARTVIQAFFWPTSTVMHIEYEPTTPKENEDCIKIRITPEQYRELITYIEKSFARNDEENFILIPGVSYNKFDNFYEAQGKYHLIYTCNNWANDGLKKVGVRTSVWSPTDKGIMYQLKKFK